ncbi:MAG: hypothetical protein ACI4VQ_05320 [Clostridia bacterium]
MKKFLEELKKDKVIHYILITLSAVIAAIPLINLRIYGTDDGFIHLLRIMGVDSILKSGQFPPFIDSKYCNGFGYAINVFYAPIVTYGPLLFKLFTNQYNVCLKLYTFATILISGVAMYKLVQEITDKREISLIAAIIYFFIPYRLETIYNRFAIGEFSAYMFIPLVFLGLYNLLKKDGKKHYYITISAVGLILTHTISTEYTAFFCLLYILLNYRCLKNKEVIKKIIINVIFTICIVIFFIVPLLEYKASADYRIFDSQGMKNTGEDVAKGAISIIQLFKDTEKNGVSFKLGITFTVLSLLGIFTFKKMKKEYKETYLTFLLIALISLFMTTKYFPWIFMPNIVSTLQFSWRMLEFAEFAMAILLAFNLYTLIEIICKDKKEYFDGILLLCSIVLIICTMQKINYNYKYDTNKNFTDEEYEQYVQARETLDYRAINREYLPTKALQNEQYFQERQKNVNVLSGEAKIKNENRENLSFTFTIEAAEADTVLVLPYLYYPGYEVILKQNNTEVKLETFESNYGFIAVELSNNLENAEISVKYKGTALEKISYIISAIAIIIFIGYIISNNKSTKSSKI